MEEALHLEIMNDGNRKNITQNIKSYGRRLLNFIKARVDSEEDAEDILQEVFYQFAGNTKPIEQITAWLFRIARNKIIDNYRKRKPELIEDIFSGDEEEEFLWHEVLFAIHQTRKPNTSEASSGSPYRKHWMNYLENKDRHLYNMNLKIFHLKR